MKNWARIFACFGVSGPHIHNDTYTQFDLDAPARVESALTVVLYPSEQGAREAQKLFGGIVVELNTEDLRGQIHDGRPKNEIAQDGGNPHIYVTDGSNGLDHVGEIERPPSARAPREASVELAARENDDDNDERWQESPWLKAVAENLRVEWQW